jgi:hypothetical protein
MVDAWMLWAAVCHHGATEGMSQCLAVLAAVHRLHEVPDSMPWVRRLRGGVLARVWLRCTCILGEYEGV